MLKVGIIPLNCYQNIMRLCLTGRVECLSFIEGHSNNHKVITQQPKN